ISSFLISPLHKIKPVAPKIKRRPESRFIWKPSNRRMFQRQQQGIIADEKTRICEGLWIMNKNLDILSILNASSRPLLVIDIRHKLFIQGKHIPNFAIVAELRRLMKEGLVTFEKPRWQSSNGKVIESAINNDPRYSLSLHL
ncbi:MAG: hypothetical protein WCR46_14985, partial [Deltaproteobacteria bacterium]